MPHFLLLCYDSFSDRLAPKHQVKQKQTWVGCFTCQSESLYLSKWVVIGRNRLQSGQDFTPSKVQKFGGDVIRLKSHSSCVAEIRKPNRHHLPPPSPGPGCSQDQSPGRDLSRLSLTQGQDQKRAESESIQGPLEGLNDSDSVNILSFGVNEA